MSKQKSLILLKMLMGILNFAILTFLAVIILYTIGMVRATYTARSFFKSYYIFTNESGKNSHSDVCGIIYFSGNY